MKRLLIPAFLILVAFAANGQSAELDAWMAKGWLARTENEFDTSIFYYGKVLAADPENVEALLGLGTCYGITGELDQAVSVYRQIMQIDDTYSEAWAGIGKMYYWMGKPKSAIEFYEKALALDPGNEEISKEFQSVRNEMDYSLSLSVGPVNEKEESYEINALISKLRFEKRIDDHFHIQANFLLDYSNRDYTGNANDTTRWFSTTWIKGSWLTRHHTVSAFAGYSMTDSKFSAYGLNWKLKYDVGKVNIANTVNAGYDYFYYWNKVGSSSVSDELQVSYRFLKFTGGYAYGMIDPVTVYLADGNSGILENPYQSFNLSLTFRIVKRPDIRVGIQNSYLDYTYKSPLYYSPFGRVLTGASASVYYSLKNAYIYGSFSYNTGTEYSEGKKKDTKINVDNWSTNMELGYNVYPFSFSVGGSNFYNPYYQNLTGFIALKIHF
jgi:tetratricopeptide (TPR) repeat protein